MSIVLDLDGTLITCEARQITVLNAVLKIHGLSVDLSKIWTMKRMGLSTERALINYGFSANISKSIASDWMRIIEDYKWLELDCILPGVNEVLSNMHKYTNLVLLTARNRPEWVVHQLQRLKIMNYFENIIIVDPNEIIYKKACWLSYLSPVAYFADTELDALAAKISSVSFFAVTTGQREASYLINWGISNPHNSLSDAWKKFLVLHS